jgi:hypothetical protein
MYMLFQEVQNMKTIDELEAFILKHGENIVDMMGAEIDRIEMKLRVSTLTSSEPQVFLSNAVKLSTNLIFCRRLQISGRLTRTSKEVAANFSFEIHVYNGISDRKQDIEDCIGIKLNYFIRINE